MSEKNESQKRNIFIKIEEINQENESLTLEQQEDLLFEQELQKLREINTKRWNEGYKNNFENFSHTTKKFNLSDLINRSRNIKSMFSLIKNKQKVESFKKRSKKSPGRFKNFMSF